MDLFELMDYIKYNAETKMIKDRYGINQNNVTTTEIDIAGLIQQLVDEEDFNLMDVKAVRELVREVKNGK